MAKGCAVKRKVFRSSLEERIALQLEDEGVPVRYEDTKIAYVVNGREHNYWPDFRIANKGTSDTFIEAKGWFHSVVEWQKLLMVKEANPQIDLRMVFQKASNKLHASSPMTYAEWAEEQGIPWADGGQIPSEWLDGAKRAVSF